jgi:DNA-directed RNA polymerase subunit RPC12/RpoP
MDALDGNAIAGELFELYGQEMTTAIGTCTNCGAVAQIAELRVYLRAPGTVVRCPNCGSVVLVIASIRGATRVDASGLRLRDQERR